MKKISIYLITLLSSVFLLTACPGKQETVVETIKVESVSLTQILTGLDVSNKEPQTPLFANVLPSNSSNKNLTWKSSDPEIIEINEKTGELNIKGKKDQTATITVTTEDGNKTASSVIKLVEINPNMIASNIDLILPSNFSKTDSATSEKYLELKIEENAAISTSVTPLTAADKVLKYSSSSDQIATVDQMGVVTAKSKGDAIITVALKNKSTIKKEVKVKVLEPVLVSKITITPDKLYLTPNSSGDLIPVFEPNNATSKKVTWTATGDSSISVDSDGRVSVANTTAGKTATIKAKATDGSNTEASVQVTIIASPVKPTSLIVDAKNLDLIKGDTHQIKVGFEPYKTTQRGVTYNSENETIATVSDTGEITAKAKGNTTITVTSKEVTSVKQQISVNVEDERVIISSLEIQPKVLTSNKISTASTPITDSLKAVLNKNAPKQATVKDVVWISEDPNIASVDKTTGEVTFNSYGKTYVWAISAAGKKSDSSQILILNLNPEIVVDTSASPDVQAKQRKEQEQLKRSIELVAIKAKNKSFSLYLGARDDGSSNNEESLSQRIDCKIGELGTNGDCEDTHTTIIQRNFEIGQTEVTYRLWNAVYVWATTASENDANKRLDDDGAIYKFQNHGELGAYGNQAGTQNLFYGDDLQPVSRVSWRDAVVWCNAYTEWLKVKAGKTDLLPVYYKSGTSGVSATNKQDDKVLRSSLDADGANVDQSAMLLDLKGIRLPTRKEWEFTARLRDANDNVGSQISFDGKNYRLSPGTYAVGSDSTNNSDIQKVGYVQGSTIGATPSEPFTHKVGTITDKVNPCKHPLKVCDMTGNLWEWTNDLITAYNRFKRANFKGSSYFKIDNDTRIGYDGYTKTTRNDWPDIGFRIARTID